MTGENEISFLPGWVQSNQVKLEGKDQQIFRERRSFLICQNSISSFLQYFYVRLHVKKTRTSHKNNILEHKFSCKSEKGTNNYYYEYISFSSEIHKTIQTKKNCSVDV